MKKVLFASLIALSSACSTSPEVSSSNTSAVVSPIPDLGAYTVRFATKNRCMTTPNGSDMSGRYVTGSNPFLHSPCGVEGQSFLFKKDDIKATGHFGAYVTDVRGKVLASSSSPWTVLKSASGQLVVRSQLSGKCLVAGAKSEVVLGACDDVNAVVSVERMIAREPSTPGATGTVACSTDNQGNAVDCI